MDSSREGIDPNYEFFDAPMKVDFTSVNSNGYESEQADVWFGKFIYL
jgi:hypothetical protein